jgi:deoxyhypusine synthase
MTEREFHDGRDDGLIPLESIDLRRVRSFADLLQSMSRTALAGRQLGEAFDIVLHMVRDPGCCLVLTVSGAMTVAKQGRIICDMIDRGVVSMLVSTGALMAHGLTESMGLVHYRHDPTRHDETLFRQGYNRIYDTLEMEANLNEVAQVVTRVLDENQPEGGVWCSHSLCRAIGKKLSQLDQGPGILRSAYERDVPVYIPAFTDSEIGLDFATWFIGRALKSPMSEGREVDELTADATFQAVGAFNPFLDLQDYARRATRSERLGILTIGGGVPRNWAQQVAPYVEITNHRLGTRLDVPRFQYGVRICPEPVHWGGLSGCTYSEGVSWGKFVPPADGGRYAEVYADATLVLPLLMKAVFETLDR